MTAPWLTLLWAVPMIGAAVVIGLPRSAAHLVRPIALTISLALEAGEYGIRVNSIHPYSVATPMIENDSMLGILQKHPNYLHAFAPMPYQPVPKGDSQRSDFMTADDVADVVVWLLSDASSYVTGEIVVADGGRMTLNYTVPA